jgi:two-component system phosphate regulon response regulator PhoB
MAVKVLVVDDEPSVRAALQRALALERYEVQLAGDGQQALDILAEGVVDAIVLDVMMPRIDGLEVCRRLRSDPRTGRIPIIMLTAKATEADRIVGLELGADDYITKPFAPRELVARVKAILRRTTSQGEPEQILRHGDLSIDVTRHEVTVGGKSVALTATEFRILHFLASKPGRVLSRDDIIDAALGRDANVFDRTIDVHITAIRRKLGPAADRVETIRGFGYKFRDTADTTA